MVLGVVWMTPLGPITMNFSTLQFQFCQGEDTHCWQCTFENIPQPIQLHSLRCMFDTKAVVECYYLNFQSEFPFETHIVPPELVEILYDFASVFEAPQGMPPAQDDDHFIHLEPQAKPVNVRPCRYPYFLKLEVESQV
ncbi:hypothetical protein GQ457_02G034080 [Hibiscus cannabinus]